MPWLINRIRTKNKVLSLTASLIAFSGMCGLATAAVAQAPTVPTGDLHQQYLFDGATEPAHFRLFVPSDYNSAKSYPLVMVLHGSASDENEPIDHSTLETIAQQRGYILVAPFGSTGGGYGNFYPVVVTKETSMVRHGADKLSPPSAADPRPPSSPPVLKDVAVSPDDYVDQAASELTPDFKVAAHSEAETMNVLALVRKQYNIDPSRIYLMGNSMGGMGTVYLAAKYPQIWAAISPEGGPVAAWSYPFERLREHHVAVLFVHGEFDEHSSSHWSQVLAETAKAEGVDAAFLMVPRGHHGDGWTKVLPETFDFFDKHMNSKH